MRTIAPPTRTPVHAALRSLFGALLCAGIGVFPAAFSALALDAEVEARAGLFAKGFDNSRAETDVAVDRILIPESFLRLTFRPAKRGSRATIEYALSSVLESRVSLYLHKNLGTIALSGGVCAGFLNDLPFAPAPGISGAADVPLGRSMRVAVYGSTSLLLSPLFSLSAGSGSGIDQNTLGGAFTYRLPGAKLMLSCDTETLKVERSDRPLKKNSRSVFRLGIATDTRDFWLDSTTGVAAEIDDVTVGFSRQRYGAVFAEETLTVRLKKAEILAGLRAAVFNFTALDLRGSAPPKTPSFGVTSGVRFPI